MDKNLYGRWPRRPNESVKQAKTRLREEGRVHLTQITWTTCSEGLNYCTSLESHSETVCVNVYESRLQSAPCRNELWFSPGCQRNVTASVRPAAWKLNVVQQNRNADIPACNRTTQSNKGTTGTLRVRGGSVRFNSTMLAVIQQTWAVPYCVRSPCSPLCKHPPCTPSRLYSDPEQEVISYPTSASAFLSQVVNVPGSRPPKPRDRGWWRAGRVQPWRAVGWTLDWNGTTRIRWYPSLMFYPPD